MQSGSSCVIVYIEPYGFKNIGFLGLDHSFKGNNFFAKSSGTSSNNKHWNTGELQKWPSKNVGTVTTNQKFIKDL